MNIKTDSLNQLVDGGCVEKNEFFIESNFGTTHFIGVGEAPEEVLSYTKDLLQKFRPEKWCGQTTQIIRTEVKLCPEGTRLIEIEQRPCGLGFFLEAGKQTGYTPDLKIDLSSVTVLYSPGRVKDEVFFSDEHLFTDHIFPWDKPRDIETGFLVIRAREDEPMPDWLRTEFVSPVRKNPAMLLLRRNADKARVYEDLALPYRVFPEHLGGSNPPSHSHVKDALCRALQVLKTLRCVVKPRRGSRAREVATLNLIEIFKLSGRSQIVKNIRKNPREYVIQPYYRGVEEGEGVCHLYRLFYVKTENGWQYLGGFLALDDLQVAKMIVHGSERVKNILIVP